jgi:hypothetical protein
MNDAFSIKEMVGGESAFLANLLKYQNIFSLS